MDIVEERALKIGLVTPFFPPAIGGATIYCFELARALGNLGHEVHVFAKQGAKEDASYVLHPVLTGQLSADLNALDSFEMDVWHALFFYYAPLAMRKHKVVVTGHGDDCFGYRFRFPLPGRESLEKRVLWRLPTTLRSVVAGALAACERKMNDWLFWISARRTHKIIAVSSFTAQRLAARFPMIRSRITVVPPGVGSAFFNNSGAKRRHSLLTVTRIDENDRIKNLHGVIEALSSLKDRYEFDYTIVGGAVYGGYREELLQLIDRMGLQQRVRILGRQTDQALLQLYAQSGLFILVSYAQPENFEGFGIVFLEANASGVPVLTSRDGGMVDYVVQGRNGFYVENTTSEGIRDALTRYFDGEISFDETSVREAPRDYAWDKIAERIVAIYS